MKNINKAILIIGLFTINFIYSMQNQNQLDLNLMRFSASGDIEMVKLLLKIGANPRVQLCK